MFRFFGRSRRTHSSGASSHSSTASSLTEPGNPDNPLPAGPNPGTGQDLAGGEYARRSRALMDLHRDLNNLGAHNMFDIPKIVVIGNQSAGKSSLVEAVTGINVPRDSGTCTRCPVKCAMTSANEDWSCTISLRLEYDADGQQLQGGTRIETFGGMVQNKGDVDIWLRRAQAAILSINLDKERWYNKSADDIRNEVNTGVGNDSMMMFTKNTIQVDIRGRGLIDLSFVDLPGLIQNAEPPVIALVRNLVMDHIQGDNTLILVTVPASDDIQNQAAIRCARDLDPSGTRTICVITKPDTVGSGAIGAQDNWKEVMMNAQDSPNYLQHGYYCVKLPDDAQRRRNESADQVTGNYFDVTRPWSEVRNRGRFGVSNLVQDVSRLLVQLIEKNLPLLRTAVENALKLCYERLGELPELLQGNLLTTLHLMLNKFSNDLRSAVIGNTHKELAQRCRQHYQVLQAAILDTQPQFQNDLGEHNPETLSIVTGIINIADIRRVIEHSTAWELPGFTPYDSIKFFIKRFLQGWDQPTKSCFEDIFQIFQEFVERIAHNQFGSYRNLHNYVLYHIRSELEKCKAEALSSVKKLLKVEESWPFWTQRTEFATRRLQWIQSQHKYRVVVNNGISTRVEYHYKIYTQEIDVMGWVKTYFDFAMERFADSMPLMVQHDLIQTFTPRLEKTLIDDITRSNSTPHGGPPPNPVYLFEEEPAIAQERRKLLDRQQHLEQIKHRLDEFPVS